MLHVPLYQISHAAEKKELAEVIVRAHGEAGGRFLKQDEAGGGWFVVGKDQCVRKTMQALREGTAKQRDEAEGAVQGRWAPKRSFRDEPTPLEAVAQVNMTTFFRRWLRRIHVDGDDPLGLADVDGGGPTGDQLGRPKVARYNLEGTPLSGDTRFAALAAVAGRDNTEALVTSPSLNKYLDEALKGNFNVRLTPEERMKEDKRFEPSVPGIPLPPANRSFRDAFRRPIGGPCERYFHKKDRDVKLLMSMAVGLPGYSYDEPHLASFEEFTPSTEHLRAELARRCKTEHLNQEKFCKMDRGLCLEWLKEHPVSDHVDVKFVKNEIDNRLKEKGIKAGGEAPTHQLIKKPPSKSTEKPETPPETLLLRYRKLLEQAHQDYSATLQTLTSLKLQFVTSSQSKEVTQGALKKLEDASKSKEQHIFALHRKIEGIESQLGHSRDSAEHPSNESMSTREEESRSSATTEEEEEEEEDMEVELVGSSTLATQFNSQQRTDSSGDIDPTEKKDEDPLMLLLGRRGSTNSSEEVAAALQELFGVLDKDDQAHLSKLGSMKSILDMMERFHIADDVQVAGCAVLWRLAENDTLKEEICKENGLQIVLSAMQSFEDNVELQAYGCAFLNSIATTARYRNWIASAGGVDGVVNAMRKHANSTSVRDWALQVLHKLSWSRKSQRAIATCGGVRVLLDVLRENSKVPDAQISGLSILCNICHDSRNRKVLSSSGGPKLCEEAIKNHPDDENVRLWARRLMDWTG